VFVLGSSRPSGTPDHVVVESDPTRLLEKVRAANQGGDVHSLEARARSKPSGFSERSTNSA
jgi:hypothetical protein